MTLAAIQDILPTFPGWTPVFDLMSLDETSVQGSGATLVKNLAGPLWKMSVESVTMRPSQHSFWKARMNSLDNGIGYFYGYDLPRTYPILYPKGTWPTGVSFNGLTAQINTLNVDNKRLALKLLPAAYTVSAGDYIAFDYGTPTKRALHQVMETMTANGSGITAQFEVRPNIRAGAAVSAVVAVYRPACIMMLVPGSLSMPSNPRSGMGTIAFDAIQVLL